MQNEPLLPMPLPIQESPEVERVRNLVTKWCEENPYKHYGDYRDQIPDEWCELMLEGEFDKLSEKMWDCEIDMTHQSSDYTRPTMFKEMIEEIGDEIDPNFEIDEEHELFEVVKETFDENAIDDFTEYWNDCFCNTNPNVTAHLFWLGTDTRYPDQNVIEFPHRDCGDEENADRVEKLKDFIKDPMAAELVYEHETLKVCGKLDWKEIWEKEKAPKFVTVGPDDSVICHSSWGGSGCMGDIEFTKDVKFSANFRVDSQNRYGVQAVYGFVGQWWSNELRVEFEDAIKESD